MQAELIYHEKGMQIYKKVLPLLEVNTYILTYKNTIIIVDPGIGINKELERFNYLNYEYKGILLTHTHYDHIVGLRELKNFQIMILEEDKKGLSDVSLNLSYMFGENFEINTYINELYEGYYNYGDVKFMIKNFPGHTPGSAIYDFGNFIFTGDFIFFKNIGRTDLPFGDNKKMIDSLKKFDKYILSKEKNTLILPGHMEICTLNDLKKYNIFLKFGGKK
ncbi:MBL fold metallo-hydrolase [Marinitoga arctica]